MTARAKQTSIGKRIASALGTLAVLAVILLFASLKWWNIFGQSGFAGSCKRNAGCESFYCLRHELADGEQLPSSGYCTESCETDADCETDREGIELRCVVPGEGARADLPPAGKPAQLCMRVGRE